MKKVLSPKEKKLNNILCIVSFVALFAYILSVELGSSSPMLSKVIQKTCVYAIVTVSMNLLNGFTGLFSLGQAGFMVIGAYTYAIFSVPDNMRNSVFGQALASLGDPDATPVVNFEINILLAIVLAGLFAAFFAFLIGLPVLKLKSDYLAIATLGFAEIVRTVIQWDRIAPLTNGAFPVSNLKSFKSLLKGTFLEDISEIIPFFVIAVICITIISLLIHSTYGRAFKAIRDDEIAAEAMGINLAKHKMISFVTSSFFAGIGGAMLAMFLRSANATIYTTQMTYEILLIVVIGGIGSITGSVFASFLFIASQEWWLRGLDSGEFLGIKSEVFSNGFRLVVFSVIIMIFVLFFRRGIMGEKEFSPIGIYKGTKNTVTKLCNKLFRKSKKAEDTAQ